MARSVIRGASRTSAFILALLAPLVLPACDQDYLVQKSASRIVVSPDLLDAGTVGLGATVALPVTLTMVEGNSVHVVAADLQDDSGFFTGPDEPLPTLAQDEAATLTFHYAPTEAGWHSARLVLETDEAEGTHLVDLRGYAVTPGVSVWPLLVDFGPVPASATATAEIHLASTGEADVELERITYDNPAFGDSATVPATIPPGDTLTIPIQFTAFDGARVVGALSLSMGAAVGGPVTLQANACEGGDATLYDVDGDGFVACGIDCDDGAADVNPGGVETCDRRDQDCDGTVDEGTECSDDDGDGTTELDGDCNDGDPAVWPRHPEILDNGIDDDCDGVVDYGSYDADGDGYGVPGGDCDDTVAASYPGNPELADGVDNDCDGVADEGTVLYDDDGDGWTESGGDCDDTTVDVAPRAPELADLADNDCDGATDETTVNGDDDGDGFTEVGGDCDDTDRRVHPAASEVLGDGIDNDCDGVSA